MDALKDKSTAKFKTWDKKEYESLARKNPVHFLCKSSSEFFTIEEVCLNEKLKEYQHNEYFLKQVKDDIDFRVKEYYKNRFEKQQ